MVFEGIRRTVLMKRTEPPSGLTFSAARRTAATGLDRGRGSTIALMAWLFALAWTVPAAHAQELHFNGVPFDSREGEAVLLPGALNRREIARPLGAGPGEDSCSFYQEHGKTPSEAQRGMGEVEPLAQPIRLVAGESERVVYNPRFGSLGAPLSLRLGESALLAGDQVQQARTTLVIDVPARRPGAGAAMRNHR